MSDPRRPESPATTGTGRAPRDVALGHIYLPRWYRIRCESLQKRRRNKRLVQVLGSATLVAAVLAGWLVWAVPSVLQPSFVHDGTQWLIETAERSRAAVKKWTSSHWERQTQLPANESAGLPSRASERARVGDFASARAEPDTTNTARRSEPGRLERARAEALAV